MRTRRYSYIEHVTGARELYDLARDPHQLNSLHHDPGYDAVRRSLATALAQLRTCQGLRCGLDITTPPAPPAPPVPQP